MSKRKIEKGISDYAAEGGRARARSLTPAARSDIARAAADARWGNSLPKETHAGVLSVGDIPCSVLDNELRVISTRGVAKVFGSRTTGKPKGDDRTRQMPTFLAATNLKPFISNDLMARVIAPVEFFPMRGGRTVLGYDATLLPDICRAILDANRAGVLRPSQLGLVRAAETMLAGLATVGIIGLIDEATGYQDVRAKNALAVILERFIANEIRPWVKTFPDDFYRHMYRLKGWHYPPDKGVSKPWQVGKLTNDIVYSRLAPGVLDELRRVSPRNERGALKAHYHRRLTVDVGHPKLRELLGGIVFLMRLSRDWQEFIHRLDQVAPKFGHTWEMPLEAPRGRTDD